MKITPDKIQEIHELEKCRGRLLRMLALYDDNGLTVDEPDNDDLPLPLYLPRGTGREVLGMLYGLVTAKLMALGVHFSEIEDAECFECNGDGKRRLRRS